MSNVTTAAKFGLPLLDTDAINMAALPTGLVDFQTLERYYVAPLYVRDQKLFIATANPADLRATDDLRFQTKLNVEPVLVDKAQLNVLINHFRDLSDPGQVVDLSTEDDGFGELDISADEFEEFTEEEVTTEEIDTPVVRLVNKLLLDAITKQASDIHIEPMEHKLRIRYRVDGILQAVAEPPRGLAPRMVARVKILSRLDIAERRLPQDGRMKLKLSDSHTIDFRVNTLPTVHGEKVVMRILDTSSTELGIDSLGLSEKQKLAYLDASSRPYGMILVTGPTGSGKTVTLYSALGRLNNTERNILTVEDPVEIHLAGITQVNVHEKVGLDFATALRAFLRQDPDIIMIGEIRDLETADIAIKASQTGHLVLATLHTNDAPSTLTRLVNMGIAPFNVASAVRLIIAQRLIRKLCNECKKLDDLPDEALLAAGFKKQELKQLEVFEPVGCSQCTNGYRGRTGIFQVMPVSDVTQKIILRGGNQKDVEEQTEKEGILSLRESALDKVRNGETSMEEVERVTNQ